MAISIPSGVTHAYAKAARAQGAEVHTHSKVEDLSQNADGSWNLHLALKDGGEAVVHAEHVVNAAGLWARECGRMVGLELPILAMEHMYLLTEDMPEVAEINRSTGKEVAHCIDFGGEIYMRQERGGMLMGTYERAGKPWSAKETPWDFGHELLQPDLDRIAPSLEVGFQHFPAFQNAGIKQIINGPFTFAPDGNPLMGPVRGLRNYWVACGVMAGLLAGRRGRFVAVAMDDQWRSGRGCLGHGRRALWGLGDARLHQRQGAGELFAPVPHSLSERDAARGAAAEDHADL